MAVKISKIQWKETEKYQRLYHLDTAESDDMPIFNVKYRPTARQRHDKHLPADTDSG